MPTVYGVPLSPFVRKVCVALLEKNISYDLNPIAPFPPQNDTAQFRTMSPLGKIPAYEDDDVGICDSSVILAYLERAHPAPALCPSAAKNLARALWIEEFTDSKLVEGVGGLFFEKIVKPNFLKKESDQENIDKCVNVTIPFAFAFDYLETQVDGEYLVGNSFCVADIGVGAMRRQYQMLGESADSTRWPKLAIYAAGVLARDSFQRAAEVENKMLGS